MPQLFQTTQAMRAWADGEIARGRTIGLVPTMGYLHDGHLSLVPLARARADSIVASIFVNPAQFAPHEDLAKYPRDLDGDIAKLRAVGVDAVFAPDPADMYPQSFSTYVVPSRLSEVLCGVSRPDHFRGVCTVVHLLFRITRARVAVFGEKDYQQLSIIRRMVRDLWLDVDVIGAPIVREPDGLAKSSRNVYLSPAERQQALVLSRACNAVSMAFAHGERNAAALVNLAKQRVSQAASARVDYIEIVDAQELTPLDSIAQPALCALAVVLGKTRLIDNVKLTP